MKTKLIRCAKCKIVINNLDHIWIFINEKDSRWKFCSEYCMEQHHQFRKSNGD